MQGISAGFTGCFIGGPVSFWLPEALLGASAKKGAAVPALQFFWGQGKNKGKSEANSSTSLATWLSLVSLSLFWMA